jgi:hypothetical protein
MKPDLFTPADLRKNTPPPLSDYGWRVLAEGDSWFSITATGRANSNLLAELDVARSTAIVNCAAPGATLQRMVDRRADGTCHRFLQGRTAYTWDAVLLSAGGNDLIAAAQTPPAAADGTLTPLGRRLLRTPEEAGAGLNAADWISEPGWATLAGHLQSELAIFAGWRNAGPSAARPLLLHTYAVPVARPAGAGLSPQGWLYPTLQAYGVPAALRQPVTELLFERLRSLLRALDADSGAPQALPGVHVFDSAGQVPLDAAQPGARGRSGDWVNEIHLTSGGYRKVGRAMGAWMAQVMGRYP